MSLSTFNIKKLNARFREMISAIYDVKCDKSIWLKLSCGSKDRTMYVSCIYSPIKVHMQIVCKSVMKSQVLTLVKLE